MGGGGDRISGLTENLQRKQGVFVGGGEGGWPQWSLIGGFRHSRNNIQMN